MNVGVLIALGIGAYLLFGRQQATATTGTAVPPQTGGTPAGGRVPVTVTTGQTVAPGAPSPSPTATQQVYSQLGTIFQNLKQTVQSTADAAVSKDQNGMITASFDVFNYYLAQVSGITPPDANQVLGATTVPTLTLEQYWSGMSAWLAANKGLSGIRRTPMPVMIPKFMSGGWR